MTTETPVFPMPDLITPEVKEKTHILIAIPAFDGRITIQLAEFLINSTIKSMDPAYPFQFSSVLLGGVSPVDYARNRISRMFLEHPEAQKCAKIWWWDNDMVPPPNVWDLLTAAPDADIVSGLYFNYGKGDHGGPGTLAIVYTGYDAETCKWTSLRGVTSADPIPITGAGAGCLLVSRRVMEDPRMQRQDTTYVNIEGRVTDMNDCPEDERAPALWGHIHSPNARIHVSEDLAFCHRALSLGYTIVGVPTVQCGHVKSLDILSLFPYAQHLVDRAREATLQEAGLTEAVNLVPVTADTVED